MNKEIIIEMDNDKVKVKGGKYIRDLIRCENCTREETCPIHNISGVEWCSIAEEREGE